MIDLDNQSEIPTANGHEAGNRVLGAQPVQHSIRSAGTATRLGGNELVAVTGRGSQRCQYRCAAERNAGCNVYNGDPHRKKFL
ncbi:MAG: diguanylate cyclase [Steroidobacteraceae bacterium]